MTVFINNCMQRTIHQQDRAYLHVYVSCIKNISFISIADLN